MGLGKTLIALYWTLLRRKAYPNPFLVVCDKSLIENWRIEADKFFGKHISIFVLHSSYTDLDAVQRKEVIKHDLVITTYNMVNILLEPFVDEIKIKQGGKVIGVRAAPTGNIKADGRPLLAQTEWAGIFADEAQAFTNPSTKIFHSMMRLKSDENWCLTGTPIRNSDRDVYSLLRFCGMKSITSPSNWSLEYYRSKRLFHYIKSMDYRDAGIKLPDIIEENIVVELEGRQKTFYQYYEDVMKALMKQYAIKRDLEFRAIRARGAPIIDVSQVQINFAAILAIFTRLRQICLIPKIALLNANTPNIMNNILIQMPDDMKTWIADDDSSAWFDARKMVGAIRITRNIMNQAPDEKILVFSSFKQVLDLYKTQLNKVFPNVKVVQLDGSQSISQRARSIAEFKDGDAQIFLITFKTGAQGLTLIEANHIIPLEPWWSPVVYDQAIGRSHRIGQKKNVFVYNILIKDSIETRIMKICSKKQRIIKQFLGREGEEISLKLDFEMLCNIMIQ